MILEAASPQVRSGQSDLFEAAFRTASAIIAASPGYLGHELHFYDPFPTVEHFIAVDLVDPDRPPSRSA